MATCKRTFLCPPKRWGSGAKRSGVSTAPAAVWQCCRTAWGTCGIGSRMIHLEEEMSWPDKPKKLDWKIASVADDDSKCPAIGVTRGDIVVAALCVVMLIGMAIVGVAGVWMQ